MAVKTRTLRLLTAALALGGMSIPAFAQNGGDGNPPAQQQDNGRRGNRQGGRGDPAQFRQRMDDRLKQELGASDEEFAALKPKLDHVMELRREAGPGGGMRMGRGGRGGPGGQGGPGAEANANPSPVQQSLQDLRKTLENKDASADDIKAKLEAVRQAKAKAHDELTKAQQDLRSVLTQRQEAVLVMMGILE